MKLISLLESTAAPTMLLEKAGPHSFSCTMLDMPPEVCRAVELMQREIQEDDLASGGLEDEVHVTICYGTHTSNVEDIKAVLREQGEQEHTNGGDGEIEFTVKGLSTFPPSKHSDGASVLKLDIESEALKTLNAAIRKELQTTCSFPDYHAHCTVAYVKTDRVEDLIAKIKNKIEGQSFRANMVTFSKQDGEQIKFDLATL